MAKFENAITLPKKVKTPTYNMSEAQIDEIRQQAHREGMHAGTYACNAMYSVAMLMALRDELGFGHVRLAKVFRRTQKLFDEIADGTLDYAELAETLREEAGINIIVERSKGSEAQSPVEAVDMFRKMRLAQKGYGVRLR